VLLLAGCGESLPEGKPRAAISGTVTVDDKPLADGVVAFISQAEGVNDTLPVTDGKFSGEVTAGERRVEIVGYKEAEAQAAGGYTPPGGATTSKENYLPAKYNTESTMKETVAAGKTFDFKVTSE
jgi:hypothetical protein